MKTNIILAGFLAVVVWSGTATANLISNGDFESGLTGWKISNNVELGDAGFAFSGTPDQPMVDHFAAISFEEKIPTSSFWQNIDVSGYSKIKISFDWIFDFSDQHNKNDKFLTILTSRNVKPVSKFTLQSLVTEGGKNNGFSDLLSGRFTDFIDVSGLSTVRLKFSLTDKGGYALTSRAGIDNVNVSPVPEPTTVLLFGAGLAGLLAAQRRKKK